MNTNQRPTLEQLLRNGHIYEAIDALGRSATNLGDRALRSRVDTLRESYGYLTDYALRGAADPSREAVYDDILASVRDIAACISRRKKTADKPTLYFNTVRSNALNPDESISTAVSDYLRTLADKSNALLAGMTDATGSDGVNLSTRLDMCERKLFNHVWTSHPLTREEADTLAGFITNPGVPSGARQMVVAAVMMGELEWHDDRRIELMAKAYLADDEQVSVKALCGLLITLWSHRNRPMRKSVAHSIAAAADSPRWERDLHMAFLQLIRARDTERVNKKITDELIPGLMKLKPDLEKRLRDSHSPIDPESFEDNPEWQEMMDKSDLSDKIKELSELQEEGSDVLMGTFGSLKTFPFFNDIHHWFIPFDAEHPALKQPDGGEWQSFVDVIASSTFLCDNDKYSLALAFSMMPAQNRDVITAQFRMQNRGFDQMKAASLVTEATDREAIANKWMQSLYRFYKLFRRKGDFDDIFLNPVKPLDIPLLAPYFKDADTLSLAAEFYFKRGYWAEAYELFDRLTSISPASTQLLQKMGHCKQRLGEIDKAIEHYEHSQLLGDDSVWTHKRLGACYRMAGQPNKALPHLEAVATAKPSDMNAALALGHCLVEMERYAEALKHYFKVEFNSPDNRKVIQPLAWALMLNGDYAKARGYYGRLLHENPTATNYLNAAHLDLLEGNLQEAADRYQLSIQAMEFDTDGFLAAFEADRPMLIKRGADPLLTAIVLDTALDKARRSGSRI